MVEKTNMKAINLILIIVLILFGFLWGCSKKNKSEQQQLQTKEETIDIQQLDTKGIPEDADPKLKKAIEKTLESASGERRSRED